MVGGAEQRPLIQDRRPASPRHAPPQEKPVFVGIDVPPGIYTSVLVASLGGVRYEITSERHGKMHAFWLLLSCVPLFLAQVTTIFLLRTDMDLEQPIYLDKVIHHATDGEAAVSSHQVAKSLQLLRLKILMVVILYLMNFNMLLSTVRLILLVLNPLTWVEIASNRDKVANHGCLSKLNVFVRAGYQAPLAFFALAMQFGVGYVVCTDSVSLILDSDSVTDVIFNSLAINFIVDLSQVWWAFCSDALHMSWEDDFKLQVNTSVWDRHSGQLTKEAAGGTLFPGLIQKLVKWTMFSQKSRFSLLRRSFVQTRMETMATFVVLASLYSRQFYVLLFAIKTNVLPAARDICTQWRMHRGESFVHSMVTKFEQCLFVDVSTELDELATFDLAGQCSDAKYSRMLTIDVIHLTRHYQTASICFFVALTTVLLAPQLVYLIISQIFERPKDEDEPADCEAAIEANTVLLERQQSKIEQLEEEMEALRSSRQE